MLQCLGLENRIIVLLTLFPKDRLSIFRGIYPITEWSLDIRYSPCEQEEAESSLISGGKLENRMREEQEGCLKCRTPKLRPTYVHTC